MTRGDVITLLEEYATLLGLLDEDEFRAKAFANAARQLESVGASLEELLIGDRLAMVRGIGPAVALAIREAAYGGTFADLESVRHRVPAGVLDLMRVDGLGPKKARTLWRDAGVDSLMALERAIHEGRLAKVSGFGGKTLDKFRASLEFLKTIGERRLRHHAHTAADTLRDDIMLIPGVEFVYFCGSLRRNCETSGDLDCIVCAEREAHAAVKEVLARIEGITWENRDGDIWQGRERAGMQVELSVCGPQELGTRLVLATGSKEHVAALRQRGEIINAATEAEVYAALGLAFVPPPLRESGLVLRSSADGDYPLPVLRSDLRGILHVHTTYSDGQHTLRQMAEAMMTRGYEFLGICDHSQVAAYARGLSPDRVHQQWDEIDELNSELAPFRILKGTECDILPDGRMDFDDLLLSRFDFVVASIHSGFQMTVEAATERLCGALRNPHVDMLGHPTGRLLLKREGYPIDHEAVLRCAAEHGKAVELNSSPHRLDLDWRWLGRAIELGVPIPLNPDAHAANGLDEITYGLELAAKGPLPPALCPSTWSAAEFLNWCKSHD